jgi:hypothetical protein
MNLVSGQGIKMKFPKSLPFYHALNLDVLKSGISPPISSNE